MITNTESGTRIDEIESGIYRISTPLPPEAFPGGFSFNQFLVVDDEPLLFHTGPRTMFPLVREAIDSVIPASGLRWIGFSHVESDESGALNDFLAIAPEATAICSMVAAVVSVNDLSDRPPRPLGHGDELTIGERTMVWLDAPHVPHNWEAGYMFEKTTRTLFCGDLFTQGGHQCAPITEADILESSEAFRQAGIEGGMGDYFSFAPGTRSMIGRMAETAPTTLACMHGSSWRAANGGTAGSMMRELMDRLDAAAAR